MIPIEAIRAIALSFPEATEAPHFEKISFRVKGKIFATYDAGRNTASLKLSLQDQDVFSSGADRAIAPVNNKWGVQGWTLVKLDVVHPALFEDALRSAYCAVAPKKLATMLQADQNEKA